MRGLTTAATLIATAFSAGACAGRHRSSTQEMRDRETAVVIGGEFPHHYLVSTEEEVRGPSAPLLRAKQGQAPLVRIVEEPDAFESLDPRFELAVFNDGTLAYEGDRCVKVGGLVLARLDRARMRALRTLIAADCAALPRRSADTLCSHGATTAVGCLLKDTFFTHRDNCNSDGRGRVLRSIAAKVRDLVGIDEWIGSAGQRQGCGSADAGMALGEIQRTIEAERKTVRRYIPKEE